MVMKDLIVLPATHTFNPQVKLAISAFTPKSHSITTTALMLVITSNPTEVRMLSWPGWLITYQDGIHVSGHTSWYNWT